MERSFYVYVHRKNTNNEIFYVGKGFGDRAHSLKNRNKFWINTVAKHGFNASVVLDGLSEDDAFDLEAFLIFEIGRKDLGTGILVNLTDGWNGAVNLCEKSKAIRAKNIQKTYSTDEWRKKLSDRQKVFANNPEIKQKFIAMISSQKGEKHYRYNHKVFKFVHESGITENCTIQELEKKYLLRPGSVSSVASGNSRQVSGWFLNEVRGKRHTPVALCGENNPSHKKDVFMFVHNDGIEFVGTRYQFKTAYGLPSSSVSRIVNKIGASSYGWKAYKHCDIYS
jgi:hypothetical protein